MRMSGSRSLRTHSSQSSPSVAIAIRSSTGSSALSRLCGSAGSRCCGLSGSTICQLTRRDAPRQCRLFGRGPPARSVQARARHCRVVILNEVKDPAYVLLTPQTSLCDHETMARGPSLVLGMTAKNRRGVTSSSSRGQSVRARLGIFYCAHWQKRSRNCVTALQNASRIRTRCERAQAFGVRQPCWRFCHPERSEGPRRWFATSEPRIPMTVRACFAQETSQLLERHPSLCDFAH